MDAGVPITAPVAGISIGLIKEEGDAYTLLTDIAGIEDFYGDMDFKVAGTTEGITAIQLDTKAKYLPMAMIPEVFSQAREARLKILEVLNSAIQEPREELSQFAPRILTVNIPVERIGEVIGPGGKMIRSIVERTGAKIDIEDDGTVFISSLKAEGGEEAAKIIRDMTQDVELGEEYTGTVTRLMNFGAFVEILPGKEGLIRISDLAWEYVESVEAVLKVGDEVKVVVNEIDDQGRTNLSRKALLPKPEGYQERAPREGGGDRGGREGGDGGGNRGGGNRGGGRPPRGEGGGGNREGGGGNRGGGNGGGRPPRSEGGASRPARSEGGGASRPARGGGGAEGGGRPARSEGGSGGSRPARGGNGGGNGGANGGDSTPRGGYGRFRWPASVEL